MKPNETVLIVDDETVIRRMLTAIISGRGYRCLEASNSDEALESLKTGDVDVALLDINMPGKPGNEFLSDALRFYPDTAVIMLTAVSDNEICIDCMRRGAYDYIIKPFNHKELVVRIEQALEKRRLRIDNREYQQHLSYQVQEQAERIRGDFFNAVSALCEALESKDKYTMGHSSRVAEISSAIAQQMGKTRYDITRINLAATVHDIGKIGIDQTILNKQSRLTVSEYELVRCHCEIGERILKPITHDEEILSMVRHHHERFDGKGYPDGLKGNVGQCPSDWGILALADSYDAMISDRPYRKALPFETAISEIRINTGTQFDAEIVEAFLKIPEINRVHNIESLNEVRCEKY